ncbi:MAG: alpha/beta hydrolase-fold protein [Fibrobacteria bacterium]
MIFRLLAAGLLSLPIIALSTPEAKLPVPPAGWDAVGSVPHGMVQPSLSYKTQTQGNQLYSIYLPPGYSTEKKYPVVYLLHGLGDDQTTWTNGSKGNAHHIMDNLIAQNKAVPMVVVMPDGAMGVNSNMGNFGTFDAPLTKDLIPHIEATYSVSKEPIDRAICGLSMGGGQTLRIGFGNPDLFYWIGPIAPASNTSGAVKDLALVKKNVRFTYLACGSADGLTKSGTQNFHDYMDQNNINPHMMQWEVGQGHSWTCFNRSFYNFSQRIFTGSSTGVKLAVDNKNGKVPQTTLLFQSGRLVVQRQDLSGTIPSARYFLDGRSVAIRDMASLPEIPNLR